MSIVLETCTACDGTGYETYSFSDIPFHGGKLPCWSCEGSGQVPVMLTRAELGEFILGEHGKAAA